MFNRNNFHRIYLERAYASFQYRNHYCTRCNKTVPFEIFGGSGICTNCRCIFEVRNFKTFNNSG